MLPDFKSIPSKLNKLLDRRRKLFLLILLFMSIFLSLVETLGVSVVMPFISIASNPELIDSGWYQYFYNLFKFDSVINFTIIFGIAIIVFYFFRCIYNVFFNYSMNKFSYGTYRYIATKLFKTYLGIPYKIYVLKNPSVLSQTIITEATNLCTLINYILQLLSESFTVFFLYIFMILVNWQITLVLTAILLLVVILVFTIIVSRSKKLGEKRYEANTKLSRTIWHAFNNFKFIRLKGNEEEVFNNFSESAGRLSRTTIISNTLGHVPKSLLENLGFSLLIAAVCYILWRYHSATMVIPIISMYALALYRMLPAINRILQYFNSIAFLQKSLQRVSEDIELKTVKEGSTSINFTKSIRGENLYFSYLQGGDVIKDVSFKINIGEKVAFTGESGSGKTTLVDIMIGIYQPLQGSLYIDDILITNDNIRSWRSKIGYIPQNIYLFDGTVGENVSFGSLSDESKIITVLKKARIWDFLETKQGLDTRVGEGGIQLSGGQKQRIGIARALYNDPEILVLDEATSSLDDATEAEIMTEIYDVSENKTLIIIAHRLSTVERCERIIRIESGEILAC